MRGGVIGNYVDQFHIFLPLVALAPALPTLAGPGSSVVTGAVVVMAMLLGRPVGGMIFGRLADRWGRTRTTRLAIAGTAACTAVIGLMPTYEVIGGVAIWLVLLARFVGGVFIAGEYSAAIPLAMEWSKPKLRGLFSGLIMSMSPLAQASVAFITAGLLGGMGSEAYAAWGWRVPFLAGALASLGMLWYYRRHVVDAPEARKARRDSRAADGAASGSLREVMFGRYRGPFWQMFGLMTGLWFMTQMTVVALPGRLATDVGLTATQVSVVAGAAGVAQALVMAGTGHLSTLLGRRRFFVVWGVLAAVGGSAVWLWLMTATSVTQAAVGAMVLQVITVTAYGPVGAYLSERLPTVVRSTGYGTAYSLSIVIPALYPFYLPAIQEAVGRDVAVVGVLVLAGALVVACCLPGPALTPKDLEHDVDTLAAREER